MAKQIPCKFAIVDDADYEWLNQFKWSCVRSKSGTYYAVRNNTSNNKEGQNILMHREILGLSHKDGKITDHIDRNGLNNQRSNLRTCTATQNQQNQRPRQAKGESSKFKGVFWRKAREVWVAQIKVNKKRRFLGYFDSEIEAAEAYNRAAIEYFREFAVLNKIEGGETDD